MSKGKLFPIMVVIGLLFLSIRFCQAIQYRAELTGLWIKIPGLIDEGCQKSQNCEKPARPLRVYGHVYLEWNDQKFYLYEGFRNSYYTQEIQGTGQFNIIDVTPVRVPMCITHDDPTSLPSLYVSIKGEDASLPISPRIYPEQRFTDELVLCDYKKSIFPTTGEGVHTINRGGNTPTATDCLVTYRVTPCSCYCNACDLDR